MTRVKRIIRSWCTHAEVIATSVLMVYGATGCQPEHRISLDEFLEMQQQVPALHPASQPAPPSADEQEEARQLIDRALGPYQVGPGDVLHIDLTSLEGGLMLPAVDVLVDRQGRIELPGINTEPGVGTIQVEGLGLEDVEDKVLQAYVPSFFRNAAAHVSLVQMKTTDVLVVGAVTQPGLVQLRRTERNLLYALVAAGGVSEMASGDVKLKRLRPPAEQIDICLTEPDGLRTALEMPPLESGDIVSVEAAMPNVIFVGGLVNAPAPQAIFPRGVPMTVLQAIASAGGLRTDVFPTEGTLIRRMPDGQDVHVKLDLNRITSSQDPNITLAAGDVLWVPHTIETRIQDWINRNIFFRAGISTTANVNWNATGIEFLNSNARESQSRGGGTLQDQFDPFGFLLRNQAIQSLAP